MSVSTNKPVTFYDGDYFPQQVVWLTNQTGSALTEGNLAAINMDLANATYNSLTIANADGSPNTAFFAGTAIAPTVDNCVSGILVLARESIAIGARGRFVLSGLVKVKCSGATAKGAFIYGTANVQPTFSATIGTQAILDALALPTAILGRTLESTAGAGTAMCWFNGYNPPISGGGA